MIVQSLYNIPLPIPLRAVKGVLTKYRQLMRHEHGPELGFHRTTQKN
jgi:hypothetical protein